MRFVILLGWFHRGLRTKDSRRLHLFLFSLCHRTHLFYLKVAIIHIARPTLIIASAKGFAVLSVSIGKVLDLSIARMTRPRLLTFDTVTCFTDYLVYQFLLRANRLSRALKYWVLIRPAFLRNDAKELSIAVWELVLDCLTIFKNALFTLLSSLVCSSVSGSHPSILAQFLL